jgi:hypothetical protein
VLLLFIIIGLRICSEDRQHFNKGNIMDHIPAKYKFSDARRCCKYKISEGRRSRKKEVDTQAQIVLTLRLLGWAPW